MNTIKTAVEENSALTELNTGMENHKKIAAHLEASSKYHLEAVRFHESGDHEKAKLSALVARGYQCLACQVQREGEKHFVSDN